MVISSRIRLLPDSLVDVIAAGEVVERPASIVKELVENALDAGAGSVRVKILDGGRKLVQVQDDGSGMGEEDALLSIERHATSKISSIEDLKHIRTLGFRGEALPSIAAVGRFTLETWDGKAPAGTKVLMEGGRLVSVEPCGRARGTTASLERVFARLPARRKFLRSRETEQGWCLAAVEDAALANPSVAFHVTGDGQELLVMPPASSLRERVASLWGAETAGKLLALSCRKEGILLEGLISPPGDTYSRRWRHRVMVNGRPVRDPALNRAVSSSLSGSWPSGRFPALVLSVTIPDEMVDVNVHPSKREVRFRNIGPVADALREAVRMIRFSAASRGAPAPYAAPVSRQERSTAAAGETALPFGVPEREPGPCAPCEGGREMGQGKRAAGSRVLGQVLGTFIVLEGPGGLEILDQHAAHERIVFNRLLAKRAGKAAPVQGLAVPRVLSLSPSEASKVLAAARVLNSFGFEIGEFGGGSVRVTAVPADLASSSLEDLLRDLAAWPELAGSAPEALAMAVSRWACRKSVMAGKRLSEEEMARLVLDLEDAESGFSCPHGRPTRVTLDRVALEKLFGRR